MEYENDQQDYNDDGRGYRERSPRGENGDSRARSASPGARDRMENRPPIPPVPTAEEEEEARNSGSNLFVTGIHPRLSEEDVTRLFEKYGEVHKCNIMRDPHTRESRGFGFVDMATGQQADAAKEGLQGEVYEGRTLSIEKARRSRPRTPTPGRYYGPPKREDVRRGPPRGRYDDRYERRGGGGYGGYGGGGGRRDDYAPRGGSRYGADRYGDRPPRSRYDDRPPRDDRYRGGRDDYGSRPAVSDSYAEPAGGRDSYGRGGYEDRGSEYSRR